MNFKNKIFITFFVLLAFILIFNINNVFAFSSFSELTDNDIYNYISLGLTHLRDVDNVDISLINNCYVHCRADTQCVQVFYLTDDSSYYTQGTAGIFSSHTYYVYFNLSDSSIVDSGFSGTSATNTCWIKHESHYLYGSTVDFTGSVDYNANLVFPQPVTEIPATTIPALETANQIPEAIVKTLKIMIPVGLVLLSIGLVIYLIKRVKYSIM